MQMVCLIKDDNPLEFFIIKNAFLLETSYYTIPMQFPWYPTVTVLNGV